MTDYEQKICVSVLENTFEKTLQALDSLSFAEVRFDRFDVSESDLVRIFSRQTRIIATARPGYLPADRRAKILSSAARLGAHYVDIELEAEREVRRAVLSASTQSGCRVIVSYHNFKKTPDRAALDEIVERCFHAGADVAKIACYARNERDAARLLGLLDDHRPLVVVGMGPKGRLPRVAGPLLGAELTYAARDDLEPTAPGQLTAAELVNIRQELVP